MNYFEIIIMALGLAMDAFAVAICLGLSIRKSKLKSGLIVGLYFGFFQGLMPVIGYFAATLFRDKIIAFDHWIAFALLLILGVKMILGSLKKEKTGCDDRICPNEICTDRPCPRQPKEVILTPKTMLPFAIATSIDALAIGVSLAFLKVKIAIAASTIGVITLALSMVGVKIGSVFGSKIKSKAEFFGGLVLILIGTKILIEHLISQ